MFCLWMLIDSGFRHHLGASRGRTGPITGRITNISQLDAHYPNLAQRCSVWSSAAVKKRLAELDARQKTPDDVQPNLLGAGVVVEELYGAPSDAYFLSPDNETCAYLPSGSLKSR